MYKTKINNEVKNYDSLLEAKMSALMSFKKNKQLVEVLDEEDNVVFSKGSEIVIETKTPAEEIEAKLEKLDTTKYLQMSLDALKREKAKKKESIIKEDIEELPVVDVQPTEEQIENAFESIIRSELSKLFTTIDDYNSDVATLTSEEASQEVIDKLNLIIDDLNTHVGILQSCLDDLSK